jgi:transposase
MDVGKQERAYADYFVKLRKNWLIGKHRSEWETDIKMNLREIGCEDTNRIQVAQDWIHLRT